MALRSQQSKVKAIRTLSPLSQPISKLSKGRRRLRSSHYIAAILPAPHTAGMPWHGPADSHERAAFGTDQGGDRAWLAMDTDRTSGDFWGERHKPRT